MVTKILLALAILTAAVLAVPAAALELKQPATEMVLIAADTIAPDASAQCGGFVKAIEVSCNGTGCDYPNACKINTCIGAGYGAAKSWVSMSTMTAQWIAYRSAHGSTTGLPACDSYFQQASNWSP